MYSLDKIWNEWNDNICIISMLGVTLCIDIVAVEVIVEVYDSNTEVIQK